MNRREMLAGAGALAAAAAATAVRAADEHAGHHHGGAKHEQLVHAAAHCMMAGQACIQHCIELLATGDKELGVCAAKVQDTLAACAALQSLASYNSPHLPAMAKAVAGICKDCEDECRKHEKKHESCKACAEACADCLKACKAVAA